ncbi:MAG TPA: SET domain-containing protein [Candidatus Paceibacterota bacterium]
MSPNNVIKQFPLVRIEIKPTKILDGEVGLFSTRAVSKGSVIVEAKYYSDIKILPITKFDALDVVTKGKVLGFCPSTPKGFEVPPDLNYISNAWYMNHSCEPNVGFNDGYDFIAIKNIKKGEELFWDYGYDENNSRFKMKCVCGSNNCRQIITGNDWMMLMKDKNKFKYFSPKLKKFIKSKNTK